MSLQARLGHFLQVLNALRREVNAFEPPLLVASADIPYETEGLLARSADSPRL